MSSKTNYFKYRTLLVRSLFAMFIATLLLLGADQPSYEDGVVSADFFEWDAEDQKGGIYGYLRQLPVYQDFFGDDFAFYATKSIWVFGSGPVMLIDWVSLDDIGRKFNIQFSYLDEDDVDGITAASTTEDRDELIDKLTSGELTQTTIAVFDGQAGLYDKPLHINTWLPEIILDPDLTPEFQDLLDFKYPPRLLSSPLNIEIALGMKEDLALDAQIYPAVGEEEFVKDTRLALYVPGYTPGIPFPHIDFNGNSTKRGWNNTISMGKDPELWMNAQGLGYGDLSDGNRRWAVVFGWNTHLDYDGKDTASKDAAENEFLHLFYKGMMTPVGQEDTPGLVMRAMALLDTDWAGVPLNGDRNVVSHSTGYYLAMDMLHYMKTLWPKPSKTRFFAISPNIRGSSLIGATGAPQFFDSQDDMFRDNWHFNEGYRVNQATQGILKYRKMNDVEGHVMLAYGDVTSSGVGGAFTGFVEDEGVVDYTNYQPHFTGSGPENLDDNEYGRRHRFSPYESIFNMNGDGKEFEKTPDLAEWENGGDDYLRNFRSDTIVSVFGVNVNLGNQEADDGEDYQADHSELAQRMAVMKMIVNGKDVDYLPAPGQPTDVISSDEKPGVVNFSWIKSPDQSATDTDGIIGGQLYEIVRRIEGNKALAGNKKWEDTSGGSGSPLSAQATASNSTWSTSLMKPYEGPKMASSSLTTAFGRFHLTPTRILSTCLRG